MTHVTASPSPILPWSGRRSWSVTLRRALTLALATAALTGCTRDYMKPATPTAPVEITVTESMATIVFIRPSWWGDFSYKIIDGEGGLVGELAANEYVVHHVFPGEHTFVVWENTDALRATVEGGKVYYVELGVAHLYWADHARLYAVGPERERWSDLDDWLVECRPVVIQPGGREAFVDENADEIPERLRAGLKSYAKYGPEERPLRTITLRDGIERPIEPTDTSSRAGGAS